MLLLYSVLVLCVNSAISGIIKAPGMQRKVLGETVTFQWSVTGSISNYSVYSQASMTLNKININANYTLDSQTGVVTLIIWNIQLSDAGNYSLSVTIGTTVQIDTGALLFVYGYSRSVVNQNSDGIKQLPSTEGDTVELTCNVTTSSLPVEYRPKMYYFWYMSWLGTTLQNISSGQAISSYGDLVPGYSIKDDGRTLVIASASYRDTRLIYCRGQEQWSPYTSNVNWFFLPLKYRPYISSRYPESRKFNAIIGNNVSLSVYFQAANPAVTSVTNWTFVDTAGNTQNLPPGSSYSISFSTYYLSFIFTSEAFYGNYSITFSNIIGSTTETFQVLRPGPPDAPSDVRADFVSHYLIAIAWNCMWFNGRQQTTYLQLKAPGDDKVIDSWNVTLDTTCYNSTYAPTTQFRNGVQPETDYEVSAWSSNDLGSSVIIKLNVKTPKIFKFFVSPKDISFNGNQAFVNFSATDGKIAQLYVTCCLELTGVCISNYFYNVTGNFNQVTIDNLPTGNVYIFDFRVYGGKPQRTAYYLTMVNGIKVSRIDEPNDPTDVEIANPLLIPVIVLGVLFGIAVLALIGCFIAFLVCKCRQNIQTNKTQQTQQPKTNPNARAPQSTTKRTNEAYEEDEDTYETVDGIASKSDTNYTALEVQRYT